MQLVESNILPHIPAQVKENIVGNCVKNASIESFTAFEAGFVPFVATGYTLFSGIDGLLALGALGVVCWLERHSDFLESIWNQYLRLSINCLHMENFNLFNSVCLLQV